MRDIHNSPEEEACYWIYFHIHCQTLPQFMLTASYCPIFLTFCPMPQMDVTCFFKFPYTVGGFFFFSNIILSWLYIETIGLGCMHYGHMVIFIFGFLHIEIWTLILNY